MNTTNLGNLYQPTIELDNLALSLDNYWISGNDAANHPPYNITSCDKGNFEISIAVAGFKRNELDVQIEDESLTISGKKKDTDPSVNYLHRGFINKDFHQQFKLAEFVKIKDATLDNGLLIISLTKIIPEELKARKIAIRVGNKKDEQVKSH
ncbi:MAG: heat-shock protein [Proteobacteria bacterium]|nr:heat-shock protein [Pseudomonadota bacterium]|tara:strand:+ start:200 stop:655 length:456 start_codon:yes stop_codon:yes gene_type:complete